MQGTLVRWVLMVFAVVGCRPSASDSAQNASSVTAITHVTVVDGTGAPPKADQTVVIANGRISAITPAADTKIPSGARVLDATGKYLIPGLWDLHVHLYFGTPEVLPVFVANGVTGIRELDTNMPEIERIRRLGKSDSLLIPRIMAAGKMIEAGEVKDILPKIAPKLVVDFAMQDRVFVNSAEEARAAVRQLAALKPDLLKQHTNSKRAIYFAVLDEAKKFGLDVAGHYPSGEKVTLREMADAGQRTIEHLGWPGVAHDFNALSPAGQDSLIAYLKQHQLAFVPTLVTGNMLGQTKFLGDSGADHSPAAQIERARKDPRARFVTPQLWQMWQGMIEVEEASKRGNITAGFDIPADLAILRKFHEGGIAVLPGTDFTVQFLFPGSSLHEELIELVKQVGMTPHEALQAATRQSAEMLHLQAQVGTVEVGKVADLVVLDADPLADIANVQRINAVVREGRLLDRAALDKVLDQAASRLQAPAR